jgi:hypothetical protein
MLNHHTINAVQGQTPTGKYPLQSGLPFFIALTRVNRSEKLREGITFPMKQYGVCFVLLESNEPVDHRK